MLWFLADTGGCRLSQGSWCCVCVVGIVGAQCPPSSPGLSRPTYPIMYVVGIQETLTLSLTALLLSAYLCKCLNMQSKTPVNSFLDG